ncbi:PLP-dependent transferase [Stella sp.]|uniref:PLP-dependent transferase n=1 Tax=Stella sp. TaxID=2912054 RepID=UPI0035AFE920
MGPLEELGIRPVINATGPWTRMGNTAPSASVRAAMDAMSQVYVPFAELQAAAGRAIVAATGAEAGYATPGAAAATTLAVAACIAGEDPRVMRALPHPEGVPATVVLFRQHRSYYDVAIRAAGARLRLVDAAVPDPLAALAAAIDAEVACVFYDATGLPYRDQAGVPDLAAVVAVAHGRGTRVVVDGSMALPPADNLRALVATGADAVSFSGGKAIGGPPASGFTACRQALLRSIALQHQDADIHAELTGRPHPEAPYMGIGRGYKVGKEQIAGLIAALADYAARDHEAERRQWHSRLQTIEAAVAGVPGLTRRMLASNDGRAPYLIMGFEGPLAGVSSAELSRRLLAGEPRIFLAPRAGNVLWAGAENLRDGEAEIVGARLARVLADLAPARS